MADRKKPVVIFATIAVALIAWAVFDWVGRTPTNSTEELNDDATLEVATPLIGDLQVIAEIGKTEKIDEGINDLDRDLIAAYHRFSFVPPSNNLELDVPTDFRASKEGLAEVRRLIQPGSAQEFIGVLNNEEFLYPGRIISITPIARPDYRLPQQSLGGLTLQSYKVFASAVTANGKTLRDAAEREVQFHDAKIPAGLQSATSEHYERFLQRLQSQGAHASNGHTVFIYKTAHTLEEGFQQLGINASYGALSLDVDTRGEFRDEQQHIFMMLKQEYFRVRSDTAHESPHVLTARVQSTPTNVETLTNLSEWKRTDDGSIPYQQVPAVIRSVTYGRVVLVASETKEFTKAEIDRLMLEYSTPTASARIEFERALKELLERATFKLVTWGGGATKVPDLKSGVSADQVAAIFAEAAGSEAKWDNNHPGRAIGFSAQYLDQATTQAHSFSLSDKSLLAASPGYPTDARFAFFCGDDQDGFLKGAGEFDFKLESTLPKGNEPVPLGGRADIDDGDGQPQWRHTHRLASMNYMQPLTLTVTAKEEDEGNGTSYPIDFAERELKPVTDEFMSFSNGTIQKLGTSVGNISQSFHKLRKLGDIHKVAEQVAKDRGPQYESARKDALMLVDQIRASIKQARTKHASVTKDWAGVKQRLGQHVLKKESSVLAESKFSVELVPHNNSTIRSVESMLKSLESALSDIERRL